MTDSPFENGVCRARAPCDARHRRRVRREPERSRLPAVSQAKHGAGRVGSQATAQSPLAFEAARVGADERPVSTQSRSAGTSGVMAGA